MTTLATEVAFGYERDSVGVQSRRQALPSKRRLCGSVLRARFTNALLIERPTCLEIHRNEDGRPLHSYRGTVFLSLEQ